MIGPAFLSLLRNLEDKYGVYLDIALFLDVYVDFPQLGDEVVHVN